jgi:hypothetical protein
MVLLVAALAVFCIPMALLYPHIAVDCRQMAFTLFPTGRDIMATGAKAFALAVEAFPLGFFFFPLALTFLP